MNRPYDDCHILTNQIITKLYVCTSVTCTKHSSHHLKKISYYSVSRPTKANTDRQESGIKPDNIRQHHLNLNVCAITVSYLPLWSRLYETLYYLHFSWYCLLLSYAFFQILPFM